MDRRQRKTREAIFNAFIYLLSKKNYNNITVGEIIEIADIGRATFYSHFETKDFLLKDLCKELFNHVFYSTSNNAKDKVNLFACEDEDSEFLHLFKHIKKNDNNIYKLLSSKNNELFLEYFKSETKGLFASHLADFYNKKPQSIPEDFWINYVSSTFIEIIKWWIENKLKQTPEQINEYFLLLI